MMPKLLTLGIVGLLFIMLSCQQRDNLNQVENASANTLTAEYEEFQEDEEVINSLDLSYAQRKGKRLYEKYCVVCHGLEGKGDGFNAYNLKPKPKDITENGYLDALTDDWLIEAINQGGRGVKRSILMPSYENTLSKKQIEEIVAYLRFLAK